MFTEFQKDRKSFFNTRNLLVLVIAGALGLFTFVHMQQLIVYQINNYTAYASEGLFGDIEKLVKVFRSVHGKDLAAMTMVLAVAGLFRNKKSHYFKFSLVYLIILGLVFLGKISGHYPVASNRHLIWFVPFSFIIVVLGLKDMAQKKTWLNRSIFVVTLLIISAQTGRVIQKMDGSHSFEHTANNGLYAKLASLPISDVVVFPYAWPTLEYYMKLIPELSKHRYMGHINNSSKLKNRLDVRAATFAKIDARLSQLPKGMFYFLVSHQGALFSNSKSTYQKWRGSYTESRLKALNCKHLEVFSAKRVQLLEMECGASNLL